MEQTFEKFKSDFESKVFSLTEQIDIEKGIHSIFYLVNGTYYSVFDFWQFYKDYQNEKLEINPEYTQKAIYLRRIIPQLKQVKVNHYTRFLKLEAPVELCDGLLKWVDLIIDGYQSSLDDIERYLKDRETHLNEDRLTNREFLLLEKYKHLARLRSFPRPEDFKNYANFKQLRKIYYTVFPENGDNYKSASKKELTRIIPLLKAYPDAQRAAENDLDSLM